MSLEFHGITDKFAYLGEDDIDGVLVKVVWPNGIESLEKRPVCKSCPPYKEVEWIPEAQAWQCWGHLGTPKASKGRD